MVYEMIDFLLNRVPYTKINVPFGEKLELAENQRLVKSLVGNGSKTYWVEEIPEEGEDLTVLKRPELDVLAEELGLDPADYKNKDAIIEAILKARK